jgi:hypothetical protein
MQFKGRSLQLIYFGLGHAILDLRNEIALCPDIFQYQKELKKLDELIEEFENIQRKILQSKDFSIDSDCN